MTAESPRAISELSIAQLCDEVATAGFVSDRPIYAKTASAFGHHSPSGELTVPLRPTKQIECLQFLVDAAGGRRDISPMSQMMVDNFLDLLEVERSNRNG